MLDRRLTLALFTAALALAGCNTEPPEPGPDDEYLGPAVVDLSPGPGQEDFFFKDDLWVLFEWAPESAELSLLDSEDNEVAGTATISSDGVLYTLDPNDSLVPSSDYTLEIRVLSPASAPLRIAFRTSPHGLPTNPEAGGLWGSVFRVEATGAVLLEPASAGAVILSQIDNWNILLGFGEESSFAAEDQPGVHILAAKGVPKGDSVEPDPCSRTASLTFGMDGLHGTDDDVPASFDDPNIELGPGDIDFVVGLIPAAVQDLHLVGIVHPELTDMKDFSVEGILDTRALDLLFQEGAEEGLTCSLLETLDIPCEECGGDNPGPYCLEIRARGVTATRVAVPPLSPRSCADIIEHFLETGSCSKQVEMWEPAADGTYGLCPEYSPS